MKTESSAQDTRIYVNSELTGASKPPNNISKLEAGIIEILHKHDGTVTVQECLEKLRQNGFKEFPDPQNLLTLSKGQRDLINFCMHRPKIFRIENEINIGLSRIYLKIENPINSTKSEKNVLKKVLKEAIVQILRESGTMTLDECWERLKQKGFKEFPELQKLKNFVRKRPNLFIEDTLWLSTAVKNLGDKEISELLKNSVLSGDTEKVELEKICKIPETVSKFEAAIIQIKRKHGMVTILECLEKLKQSGITNFPDVQKLAYFIKKRPNLFHFDEKTDKIWLSKGMKNLTDKELSELLEKSGLIEVQKMFSSGIKQDISNSMRISVKNNRQAIMFKSEWLYSKVPEFWDSCQKMIISLNALSDKFITSGKCIHLRDLFEKSLIPEDDKSISDENKNISVDLVHDNMKNSERKFINSELESLKTQLNDLKSFLNETPFRKKTRGVIKDECSVRFKTILEDIEMLQSRMKTSQAVDEVKDVAFEETFNYLAPPNEAIEENLEDILEI